MRTISRHAITSALLLAAAVVPARAALAPPLAALSAIELGRWQLRGIGAGVPSRDICLRDGRSLLQLRHEGAVCSRFVIQDQPTTATVHYTCGGNGHGQTTIRVETPRLVHIETTGIAANAPFDLEYEGRRIGPCG